ncbi:MAG: hypothetical protein KGO02_21165, partial [Alphaproteobacteria bacterium]|nr:hypothetical protein [Alphaproteobacteria bacterium]
MIGRPNKAFFAATFAVSLFILGPALAQPLRPVPGSAPHHLRGDVAHPPSRSGVPALAPATAPAVNSGVSVHVLGAVEGPPAGTLAVDAGGLGPVSLWSGTPKLEAEALLDALPIATTVAPVRALARRLLLTTAVAPLGTASHAFVTVRLRRLLDAGLLADAGTLALAAEVAHDPDFDRARADALLYANQTEAICGPATARRLHSSTPFWIRLRAYCYSVQGNMPAAQLTLSVMQAQGLSDRAFSALLADLHTHAARMPDKIENAD